MSNEVVAMAPDLTIHEAGGLLEVAHKAEQLVEAVKKIKEVVLAVTNDTDWVDEQGKPYLQASGAEKIRPLFGIDWVIGNTPEIEEAPDGHRTYKYHGNFTMAGRTVSIIGSRSSKDPFFSRKRGADVAPDDINMANVDKAAYTNTIGNGVTRVLGIRNMTWEELSRAGISKKGGASVDRSGVPRAPKFGKFADQPLSEVNEEWLERYANTMAEALDIPEKEVVDKDDSPEEKKRKKTLNDSVDKKIRFKASNEKMLQAIIHEMDGRRLETDTANASE